MPHTLEGPLDMKTDPGTRMPRPSRRSVGRALLGVALLGFGMSATSPAKDAKMEHPGGSRDLPFSQGMMFSTLDEYLAHRKKLGTMDRPYYREIAPGLYELMGGSPTAVPLPRQLFTREELMEKYGFDR